MASSSSQEKSFQLLQEKLNLARKRNEESVLEEFRGTSASRRADSKTISKADSEEKNKDDVVDPLLDKQLNTPAEDAAWLAARHKKHVERRNASNDPLGSKTAYRSYKKRQKIAKKIYKEKSAKKVTSIDVMVNELEQQVERRKNYNRKIGKEDNSAKDIDYINEANRKYNRKVANYYDEYTKEIRDNLERGTNV